MAILVPSFVSGSSSFLQIMRTCIKALMSLNLSQISAQFCHPPFWVKYNFYLIIGIQGISVKVSMTSVLGKI